MGYLNPKMAFASIFFFFNFQGDFNHLLHLFSLCNEEAPLPSWLVFDSVFIAHPQFHTNLDKTI